MIFSDHQYKVSLAELEKLQKALDVALADAESENWIKAVQIDALRSQISDIEAEIAEYNSLKSGETDFTKNFALEELPHVLVRARIAAGMSQSDLAQKLGMKPQQIQRYEATDYMGASLARLIEVSNALNVKTAGFFEGSRETGGSVFVWGEADNVAWSQLPYKEMIKRNWLKVARNENPVDAVKDYFLSSAGPQFATAYHRKKMRSGNVPNEYALLAWQARILEKAREEIHAGELGEFELDDRWIKHLVALTRRDDGPKQAKKLLAERGVILVVERHLSGSYLDGAAMLGDSDRPVVGLTLRYDRLDNFWFVLLHELGHVFLHLFDGMRYDFFDEEGGSSLDRVESEADTFALNALIPDELWDQCLSRFALSDEAVNIDAENLGIDSSIIAGRIRKERNDYTILSDLVGQGRVRAQLEEAGDVLD